MGKAINISPTNTGFNALGTRKPVTASPAPMPSSQTMVCGFPDQIHPSNGSANKHTHPNCFNCRAEGDQFISTNFTRRRVPENTGKATEIAKNEAFANRFLPMRRIGKSIRNLPSQLQGNRQKRLRKTAIRSFVDFAIIPLRNADEKGNSAAIEDKIKENSQEIKHLTKPKNALKRRRKIDFHKFYARRCYARK